MERPIGSARLSRWHIGAIPATSDLVTSSGAVHKHCSLTTINTRHHSIRKRYRCRFSCSAHFLITSTLSLLRAIYPKQDIKHVECVLELCGFAAALRPF
jgi:hypothetical protein